jgi:DNA ligase-1
MTNVKRPLKPATVSCEDDLEKLSYPVYISPKLDGIRATVHPDGVLSASGKLLPSKHIQRHFGNEELVGLDGELILGDPAHEGVFKRTHSVVMSQDKAEADDAVLYVFDLVPALTGIPATEKYKFRFSALLRKVKELQDQDWRVEVVPQFMATNKEEVIALNERFLKEGYEGICIRDIDGKHKHGRSTFKQQSLLKWKPFVDSDAVVTGVGQAMHNGNKAVINEQGLTERSHHQENKTGKGYVGTLECTDIHTGESFKVGVFLGVTIEERTQWWQDKGKLLGKYIKYKYMAYGKDQRPRHPKFLGWRDAIDIEVS